MYCDKCQLGEEGGVLWWGRKGVLTVMIATEFMTPFPHPAMRVRIEKRRLIT